MIEFLLVSLSVRVLLFELDLFTPIFKFVSPKLLLCPYCNGFWASAIAFPAIYGIHLEGWSTWLVYCLIGAWVNYAASVLIEFLKRQ